MATKRVRRRRQVQPERRCRAAEPIGEARRNAVLRRRRSAPVRDRKRPVDDLERTHIEHVAARRRARQAVVDEIEERLLDLIGMRALEREVAAKRGRERLRMTQRPDDRAERGERGIRGRRNFARSCRGGSNLLSCRAIDRAACFKTGQHGGADEQHRRGRH